MDIKNADSEKASQLLYKKNYVMFVPKRTHLFITHSRSHLSIKNNSIIKQFFFQLVEFNGKKWMIKV